MSKRVQIDGEIKYHEARIAANERANEDYRKEIDKLRKQLAALDAELKVGDVVYHEDNGELGVIKRPNTWLGLTTQARYFPSMVHTSYFGGKLHKLPHPLPTQEELDRLGVENDCEIELEGVFRKPTDDDWAWLWSNKNNDWMLIKHSDGCRARTEHYEGRRLIVRKKETKYDGRCKHGNVPGLCDECRGKPAGEWTVLHLITHDRSSIREADRLSVCDCGTSVCEGSTYWRKHFVGWKHEGSDDPQPLRVMWRLPNGKSLGMSYPQECRISVRRDKPTQSIATGVYWRND